MLQGVADVAAEVSAGTVYGTRGPKYHQEELMHVLTIILLVIAALCFLGAAIGAKSRINLVGLGLLAWVLSILIPELV